MNLIYFRNSLHFHIRNLGIYYLYSNNFSQFFGLFFFNDISNMSFSNTTGNAVQMSKAKNGDFFHDLLLQCFAIVY